MPPGVVESLVHTVTEEGEYSWDKCFAASDEKLLGKVLKSYGCPKIVDSITMIR